jgi:D-alanyl-lipoteichoic acid acyltransferase DltB (MBOAT superfamily)
VSLSTWFRDYVYVPLGGSRVGKLRHWRNLAVVFLLSGLWHGASWTFVVWGALHASFVLAGELFAPARSAMLRALGLSRDGWPARIASVGWTFCLVTTAWIFFRASNFGVAFHFLRHGFDHFGSDLRALLHGQEPGLSIRALPRVALGVAVVALEVVAATRGGVVSAIRAMRPIPRYAVYFSLIYGTMLLGGGPASQQQFIYFQF